MALPTWATHVTVALNILTLVATTVACTFATIAAVGFRGTEWGRALAPLPVVFAAMTVSTGVTLHPATPADGGQPALALWAIAIVAITVSCWRFVTLFTERRVVGR
ncbi:MULTISPECIES: hypothetical protein [Halobacterium]|uniref:hypothetical protein n=1 Tax=Halobacterium TaxID=2239 RepID=UPI00073F1E5F|nr:MULTISPECIES: hypothetical protein [Halobacterium]MCG1003837.1 hypothetical protein [Halobacterium noricense]